MFYFIEIMNMSDGSIPKAIWDKETYAEAEMQFHQTLASAMANENVEKVLCMVVDITGKVYRSESWKRDKG